MYLASRQQESIIRRPFVRIIDQKWRFAFEWFISGTYFRGKIYYFDRQLDKRSANGRANKEPFVLLSFGKFPGISTRSEESSER